MQMQPCRPASPRVFSNHGPAPALYCQLTWRRCNAPNQMRADAGPRLLLVRHISLRRSTSVVSRAKRINRAAPGQPTFLELAACLAVPRLHPRRNNGLA
jgi:hypothetical protein